MTLQNTHFYESQLFDDLKRMGRDNFSHEGACALQEYLDSEDMGVIEYDPIAFCCEFSEWLESEYESLASEYSNAPQPADYEDSDEWQAAFIDWLESETTVIRFNGGIIIGSF